MKSNIVIIILTFILFNIGSLFNFLLSDGSWAATELIFIITGMFSATLITILFALHNLKVKI